MPEQHVESNLHENERLRTINQLYDQILATYEYPRPLTELAERIGLAHTTLGKWLRYEAIPRKTHFETAERRLSNFLAMRRQTRTYQAENVLKAAGATVRPTRMFLDSRIWWFTLGVAAGAAASLVLILA